jgi:hypothetical protein
VRKGQRVPSAAESKAPASPKLCNEVTKILSRLLPSNCQRGHPALTPHNPSFARDVKALREPITIRGRSVFNLVLKFDFGTDLALTVTQISEEFW